MKIIFLDIDGVLNSYQSSTTYHYMSGEDNEKLDYGNPYKGSLSKQLCPIAIGNLYRIVKETDASIVISSTWRIGADHDKMLSWFDGIPLLQEHLIGETPILDDRFKYEDQYIRIPRGVEINHWLNKNDIKTRNFDRKDNINNDFAILDDDSDMWPLENNFFHIDAKVGLDYNKADEVINFLLE